MSWCSTLQLEEAMINAWPALQQTLLQGWVLRFSRGMGTRTNCIVPLYPCGAPSAAGNLERRIRRCENLYARARLQTAFKISSTPGAVHPADLDQVLARRGYLQQQLTRVLTITLDAPALLPGQFRLLPLDQWLPLYSRLTGLPEPARALHEMILKNIHGECGFAAWYSGTPARPVACALCVVDGRIAGLYDIFTDPDHRGEGVGRQLVSSLLNWASNQGAAGAYLQVDPQNSAAEALYTRLGFAPAYRYWYRVAP